MNFKKILQRIRQTMTAMGLFFVLYFLFAITLPYIPSNVNFKPSTQDGIEIYLRTDGVHTDIILPLRTPQKDWTPFLNPSHTKSGANNYQYAAFGWGEKDFYLHTPTWDDLKLKTALNAMFFLNTTVMHVSFYQTIQQDESCKKIRISTKHYQKLIAYIENSFKTANNQPIRIAGASYGNNDLFYEAKGTYSMFYTCNTWANEGLKTSGLKACLWTVFAKGIIDKYP